MSLTRDRLLTSAPAEAMSKWIIASLNPARQRASSSSGVRESELELEGSWVRSSPGAHKKMSHSPRCYLLVIHLLIYFCFTFISHSIIIPSNFISRNWTEERSATPGGYSSKFYVLYGQAPITLLHTAFDRKATPFVYLLFKTVERLYLKWSKKEPESRKLPAPTNGRGRLETKSCSRKKQTTDSRKAHASFRWYLHVRTTSKRSIRLQCTPLKLGNAFPRQIFTVCEGESLLLKVSSNILGQREFDTTFATQLKTLRSWCTRKLHALWKILLMHESFNPTP